MRKQECVSNNEIIKTGDKTEAAGKQFVSQKRMILSDGRNGSRHFYDFLQSFPRAEAGERRLGAGSGILLRGNHLSYGAKNIKLFPHTD